MDYSLILFGVLVNLAVFGYAQDNFVIEKGADGCSSSEETSEEAERIIEECQGELEEAIMEGLDRTLQQGLFRLRRKRDTEVSMAERRMNGCILQCMFRKYNILEEDGLPSRSGLLSLITEGVTDRRYFMAASKSVDRCYVPYRDFRHKIHTNGQAAGAAYCDIAYNAFECFSEDIQAFCEDKIVK